jgi:hypothetical protein
MREAFPAREADYPLHADPTKAALASVFFPIGLAALGFIVAAAVVEVLR